MRGWSLIAVLCLGALGCPSEAKRTLPPDPPGMQRAEGAKISIPLREGYQQVTTGNETIARLVARGGVAIVKGLIQGTSIVVEVSATQTESWSKPECESTANLVAANMNATVSGAAVLELPTGQACRFVAENPDGTVYELVNVAGKPSFTVACRAHAASAELSGECQHVASWIRLRPSPGGS